MNDTVSVIIPVYNSEKFLARCIDSILNQTYKNFELLLIDDGSTDQSGFICESYREKDSRIKVIHQCNSGASAARNLGIQRSAGKYLMFCDSDDIVGPMWIEHLVSYAKEGILPVCAYCTEYDQLGKTKNLEGVINEKEVDRSAYYYYHKAGIAGFLWNALYSRNVIIENHLFFRTQQDKGDYNEDLIFALSYVDKIEGLIYTGYADYLYNMRGTSLSHSYQRYYFDKYAEKYIFWKKFVEQENALEHELCLKELATELLYHVLISLQRETEQTDEFFSKEYLSLIHI